MGRIVEAPTEIMAELRRLEGKLSQLQQGMNRLSVAMSSQKMQGIAVAEARRIVRDTTGSLTNDHGKLVGLEDDDHVQYALLAGRSGGQVLYGGSDASENLTLISTAHATKGEIKLGSLTNYTVVEGDGTLKFVGDSTVWDTIRVTGLEVKLGVQPPGFAGVISASLGAYAFDGAGALEQVFFIIQIPHNYKEGSVLKPHVHWMPTTNDTGDVVWQIDHSWANIDDTFPSETRVVATASAAGGTAWDHKVASFADISGTDKTISSAIVFRLFRDSAHASDTYEHDAAFIGFDLHYEVDTVGSRAATTK